MQLGAVVNLSIRWLILIFMRPHEDEVEFLYEIMSVTGEAAVMTMICLNYFKLIEVIQMEQIPPVAILLCSLLIVAGNLGAQVCTPFLFRLRLVLDCARLADRYKQSCLTGSQRLRRPCTTISWGAPSSTETASRLSCSDGLGPFAPLILPSLFRFTTLQ